MSKDYLASLTTEDREKLREKALLSREAKKLAEMNPLMSAHEEVGLLLEYAKEMK